MKRLWLLFALTCTSAVAEEVSLVIPQLSKGKAVAEADPFHAQYKAAWGKYEQAIATVVAKVTEALDAEFNKAADRGSLDSAEMWRTKRQVFLESKTVTWKGSGKAKIGARKKPDDDAPKKFDEVLVWAQEETDKAVKALQSDYITFISESTKARDLERAKRLREEMAGFAAKPTAQEPGVTGPSDRPRAKMDPPPKAVLPFQLGTYDVFWVDDKNKRRTGTATFEFLPDGSVKRNGVAIGKWVVSLGVVQVVYDDPSRGKATLRALSDHTFEGGQVTADKDSSSWKGVRRSTK